MNINQSEQIDQFFTAMAKAQGAMTAASKDSKNPFFNSKYADLASVWSACREALSSNGICALQTTYVNDQKELYLKTTLGHSSGQWISSEIKLDVPAAGTTEVDKYGKEKKINVMQVLGSILTYQKRYQLCSIVGVAPAEDDDGNAARDYQIEPTKPIIKMASPKQIEELNIILAKCSQPFKQSIKQFLSTSNLKSLNELTEKMYKDIIIAAIPDSEAYQASIKEQVA